MRGHGEHTEPRLGAHMLFAVLAGGARSLVEPAAHRRQLRPYYLWHRTVLETETSRRCALARCR
jgi:hypothetical protein